MAHISLPCWHVQGLQWPVQPEDSSLRKSPIQYVCVMPNTALSSEMVQLIPGQNDVNSPAVWTWGSDQAYKLSWALEHWGSELRVQKSPHAHSRSHKCLAELAGFSWGQAAPPGLAAFAVNLVNQQNTPWTHIIKAFPLSRTSQLPSPLRAEQ